MSENTDNGIQSEVKSQISEDSRKHSDSGQTESVQTGDKPTVDKETISRLIKKNRET
jgi:hypothetical protein